jgi:hypothetical protein
MGSCRAASCHTVEPLVGGSGFSGLIMRTRPFLIAGTHEAKSFITCSIGAFRQMSCARAASSSVGKPMSDNADLQKLHRMLIKKKPSAPSVRRQTAARTSPRSDTTQSTPKSEAGERTVPLPPMVVSALREWKLACPKGPLGLVFPNGAGKVENQGNIVNRGWVPVQIAAGVCNVVKDADGKVVLDDKGEPVKQAKYTGLHALRHFFASWCINRKVDGGLELPGKVVQERLGHSTIAMTMDTYGICSRGVMTRPSWRPPSARCWVRIWFMSAPPKIYCDTCTLAPNIGNVQPSLRR